MKVGMGIVLCRQSNQGKGSLTASGTAPASSGASMQVAEFAVSLDCIRILCHFEFVTRPTITLDSGF